MEPRALVLCLAAGLFLPAAIRAALAPSWPRPWPWRLPASRVRRKLIAHGVATLGLFWTLSHGYVTPEAIGWKGWPTWPAWAFLLALLWGLPWLRGYLLMRGPPATHAEARSNARRAVRALACDVPRERDAQDLDWLNAYVLYLVNVAVFYGLVVHLGAAVLGGTVAGVALGGAYVVAPLRRKPRQHAVWLLFLFALNCLVLFSPIGLGGVLVLAVLVSLTEPRPASGLRELRAWIEHLRREAARHAGGHAIRGP